MADSSGPDSRKRCAASEENAIHSGRPGSRPTGAPRGKMGAGAKIRLAAASPLAVAALAVCIGGALLCVPFLSSCTMRASDTQSAKGSAGSAETHTDASGEASDSRLGGTRTVIFDSELVGALGYDSAADFIDDGKGTLDKDNVKTGYIAAEATSDGGARVTMSGLQLERRKRLIQGKIDEATQPYDESRLSVASDLKTVDVRPTRDEAFEVKVGSIMFEAYRAAVYCMEMQVLEHPGDASSDVLVRVYDHDSGRLVAQGDMRDGGVSYTEEDWDTGETTD